MSKRTFVYFIICIFSLSAFVYADFEGEVIDLVNDERMAEGLNPLSYDPNLTLAARGHSQDMGINNYFNHISQDGMSPAERITAAGYSWNSYGENIAAGYSTPQAVVAGWMASPGHRANILNPSFCDIGVGYAYVASSSYGHYWTQNFGRKSGVYVCPEAATFVITATAGSGGSITPEGHVFVSQGDSRTFRIIPDDGYRIDGLMVDNQFKSVATSYTFLNVNSHHTIDVTFAYNQSPPTADAGADQSVTEGSTVILDGTQSSDPDDAVVAYEWTQLSGPAVMLSDENAAKPTFVAGPFNGDTTLVFRLEVFDSGNDSDTDMVTITIKENDIDGLPDEAVSFQTTTAAVMGLKPAAGAYLVSLKAVDPESLAASMQDGMPANLTYGLVDIKLAVNPPGSSTIVTIYLPEPLPSNYRLYKHSSGTGWYDYSAQAHFNAQRDQIDLVLVDGGDGDADGEQDGFILDPFALGTAPPVSAAPNIIGSSSSGGGGGGCFIETAQPDIQSIPSLIKHSWLRLFLSAD